jgi:hypothetical protein
MRKMDAKRESVLFHYELGRAISQWANVEAGIASVLAVCLRDDGEKASDLNPKRIEAMIIEYEALDTFRAKVMFARDLFGKSRLGTVYGEEFADLLESAEQLAVKRNRMAHWQASHIMNATTPGRRVLLQPRSSKLTILEKFRRGMGLRDIAMARLEFLHCFVRFVEFTKRFSPMDPLEPASTYAGLPKQAPTLAALEAGFWAEVGEKK